MVLRRAGIVHVVQEIIGGKGVYLSQANQLFAEYGVFRPYRQAHADYRAWEAHHVVELQDLARLGIAQYFPAQENQLTVLLPPGGHRGRINARLRVTAPLGLMRVTTADLMAAYRDAYGMLGNYCGATGGEAAIQRELMQIVKTYLDLPGT